jgi:hypothetical protein
MVPVARNAFPGREAGLCYRLLGSPVLVTLGIAVGLMLPGVLRGATESLEYQVKAAFLLNFTKFVEWPATAFQSQDSPIAICILGTDPFGSALDEIVAGEVVSGRKVVAQRIKAAPAPKACQVLFFSEPPKDVKILTGLGPGILTVGEGGSFVHDGGMIAFLIESRRVRFEINPTTAQNARLKLSSRLLSVAKIVEK